MSVASLCAAHAAVVITIGAAAFSIVELLVVFGMLAVAASVLLPSMNRARDTRQKRAVPEQPAAAPRWPR